MSLPQIIDPSHARDLLLHLHREAGVSGQTLTSLCLLSKHPCVKGRQISCVQLTCEQQGINVVET